MADIENGMYAGEAAPHPYPYPYPYPYSYPYPVECGHSRRALHCTALHCTAGDDEIDPDKLPTWNIDFVTAMLKGKNCVSHSHTASHCVRARVLESSAVHSLPARRLELAVCTLADWCCCSALPACHRQTL